MSQQSGIRALLFALAALAAGSCFAQQSPETAVLKAKQDPVQTQAAQSGTIVVPAGTQIAATLSSPINGRTRKGQRVRAMVAFPVTVGTRLVIPAGTYVSGVIEKIERHGMGAPSAQIQFTSLVYANGYTVPLEASNAQADLTQPVADARPPEGMQKSAATAGSAAFAGNAATSGPTPAPMPSMGPPKGFIIGIVVSAVATAALLTWSLVHRHHAMMTGVLFDMGWHFDIVLQNPLTLDAASVNAAIAASPVQ